MHHFPKFSLINRLWSWPLLLFPPCSPCLSFSTNPIHRGQGLASQPQAWQRQRQEAHRGTSLSDSFSSRFYCRMFISDFGGSAVAPFHFPARTAPPGAEPHRSAPRPHRAEGIKMCPHSRGNLHSVVFFLRAYAVAMLNGMVRPLC